MMIGVLVQGPRTIIDALIPRLWVEARLGASLVMGIRRIPLPGNMETYRSDTHA